MRWPSCLMCLSVLLLYTTHAAPIPVVHSQWGTIQGVTKTSPVGMPYVTYLGIPYAKAPVGDLRFKAPVPVPSPQGVFKTSANFGAMCPQPNLPPFILSPQSEDCLTLNVFTPSESSKTPRAVMVWIHGGGWVGGAASFYDMWKIVTEANVIGVSIQYRLGVLGFLNTGSKECRGNYAMLDQVLALKWVKDNIVSFGGDDNNITIYGESAGSGSVSLHTLSPLSKGLFKRAIMQSGTAPGYWVSRTDGSKYAYQVAKNVNCPIPPSEQPDDLADVQMLECLRKLPFRSLVDNTKLNISVTEYSANLLWNPAPDNHFLMGDPARLIQDTKYLESVGFYDYDLMFGVNNAEGSYVLGQATEYTSMYNQSATDLFSSTNYYTNDFLPTMVNFVYGHSSRVGTDALVYQSEDYEGYQQPYPLFSHTARSVLEQSTDIAFAAPAHQAALAHSPRTSSSSGKTYLYYFDHYPSFRKNLSITGMPHGADIDYSFGINETFLRMRMQFSGNVSQKDYHLSDTFVQMLAEFAKTG